jgi:Tol biopolymer transport system component
MPEDTHEDVRRRLFDAAWDTPAYAPAPERTVIRARRRAAVTISGGVVAAALVTAVVVFSVGGILGMDGDRSTISPREQDPRVYLVNVTTGKRTKLSELPRGAWLFDLSPDGSELAFVADTTGSNQVWVVNMDGSGLRQVTDDPYEGSDPAWSPDGRQIAYVGFGERTNRGLFVIDLGTGKTKRLTNGPSDPWNPEWSPDGQLLVYYESVKTDLSGGSGNLPPDPTSLRVNSVEVATRRVRSLAGGKPRTHAWDGIWSAPDRILFFERKYRDEEISVDLWLMHGDGSRKELILPLAADEAYAPARSPDGGRIAYTQLGRDGWRIHIFDLSTGEDRSVARGQFATWVDDDTLLVQEALPALD